jgi:branched-chain amino acid transport system substrate-binding protein
MINDRGGIKGRKINLISLDDGYSPPKTLEQTRKLVEGEGVAFIYNTNGPGNLVIRDYLNEHRVPQLFIQVADETFNDPQHYPWTMGLLPTFYREALVDARYILAHKPDAKIAILRANDGSTEIVKGLRDGLGDQADKLIVKELTYEVSNPTVNSQIVALKSSGANTFYDVGYTKFASRTSRACGRAARRRSSFRSTWTERGLNVIRRPGVLAQRASKNGGPEIARHPSRLWLCPRT